MSFRLTLTGRRLLLGAALVLGGNACIGAPPPAVDVVWVSYAPPRPPHEARPRAPGRTYIWIEGYYRWTSTEYVWVPGHWEQKPHPRAHWHRGRWYRGNRGWYWVDGRWEER